MDVENSLALRADHCGEIILIPAIQLHRGHVLRLSILAQESRLEDFLLKRHMRVFMRIFHFHGLPDFCLLPALVFVATGLKFEFVVFMLTTRVLTVIVLSDSAI